MQIKIKKKNGSIEVFDTEKIKTAVTRAADRIGQRVESKVMNKIIAAIKQDIHTDLVNVFDMHKIVCGAIKQYAPDVAASYQNFRDYKMTYARDFEKLFQQAKDVLLLGDRENANFDSSLVSTKGSLIRGYTTSMLYKKFYLHHDEAAAIRRGDIYVHDLRDQIMASFNCSLFDIEAVLKDGFEMSNIRYREPSSVLSALQVIGDVTLVSTAQQFGGFTLSELDRVLTYYAKKTLETARKEYDEFIGDNDEQNREKFAWKRLTRELTQGFQGLELKLNTVPCSRGDFAFTTITFGAIPKDASEQDKKIQRYICEIILKTRKNGHNGIPVVFPKLVYLYSKKQHEDPLQQQLFEKALQCSAETMYPDYLSIDSDYGSVSDLYKKTGKITSPMGCRAYLTPWQDPETGEYITIGRCNIGAVSLNLPLIWEIAAYEHPGDTERAFFELLDDRLEMIRNFHKRKYEVLRNTPCSTNPMCFTQGGLYKGTKKPTDKIGDLVNYMTASFGITALHELTEAVVGKSLLEDQSQFAEKVVDHILEKINEFKKQDGWMYALYGTPAESLCQTQANQLKAYLESTNQPEKAYKVGSYLTNSFHCHVSENITPMEKQDAEFRLFHKVNGGHIQYVRIDTPDNIEGMKAIVQRGMEMGFYQGVNFDSMFCKHCGKHSVAKAGQIMTCPSCKSHDVITISRVCGYLGYSNVGGQTRMNEGKMAELKARVSM